MLAVWLLLPPKVIICWAKVCTMLLNSVSKLGRNWLAKVVLWHVDPGARKECFRAQGHSDRTTPDAEIHFGANRALSILM